MAKRRKRNQKLKICLIVLVVLAVASYGGFLIWKEFFRKNEPVAENLTEEEQKTLNSKKNENIPEKPIVTDDEGGKKVVQFDGEDPNESEELTGAVTFAGVAPDGGKLTIRVNIDQFLEGGTCTGYIYNGEELVYQAEVGIESSASTSTCQGFDVPTEGLGSGDLQIVIRLKAGDKTGKIVGGAKI